VIEDEGVGEMEKIYTEDCKFSNKYISFGVLFLNNWRASYFYIHKQQGYYQKEKYP